VRGGRTSSTDRKVADNRKNGGVDKAEGAAAWRNKVYIKGNEVDDDVMVTSPKIGLNEWMSLWPYKESAIRNQGRRGNKLRECVDPGSGLGGSPVQRAEQKARGAREKGHHIAIDHSWGANRREGSS